MLYLISKYLITAGMVVLISELAKKSDRIGALVASLPLVTILTLIWLFVEGQSDTKISNHAYYTFWYVIPTLPMFILFPYFMSRFGFAMTLVISVLLTIVVFVLFAAIVKHFGINLM
ncbi:conserved hypothetical protein [Tolumonas auensis DSM 9187]|uniref:DUF3147 family protein n=1 Tax=Tolumonas auensis (strain DSM 9187 / NBRC 110442 / TA 4) TaxID=595494 RepID=C4LE97_TOLAT|nr:DUF3147 family protein [Tolumonas auensis]ACQ92918.1 conserved hypothetical protein [Tolumonas auensis DSM 9187]